MSRSLLVLLAFTAGFGLLGAARLKLEEDVFPTAAGELKIFFVGHASLFLTYAGKVVHVDPVGSEADYSRLPKADLVLITHDHGDHLDPGAVEDLRRDANPGRRVPVLRREDQGRRRHEERRTPDLPGIRGRGRARLQHRPQEARREAPSTPKGRATAMSSRWAENGSISPGTPRTFPRWRTSKDIDIAFLPMNLPYTMTPEMTAAAARMFRPKVLYPYHFGETDPERLVKLLEGEPGIEVRVRPMS